MCNPQNQYSRCFCVIHRHTQRCEKFECPLPIPCTFPAEAEQGDNLPPCFSSCPINRALFPGCYVPWFLHFCALRWWVHCLQWLWTVSAKVLASGPEHNKAGMCVSWTKYVCEAAFLRARITGLWAVSSASMNQQRIWNKVSLSRNPHTRNWSADKNSRTRGFQEPNPVFSLGAKLQSWPIQYSGDFLEQNCRERHESTVDGEQMGAARPLWRHSEWSRARARGGDSPALKLSSALLSRWRIVGELLSPPEPQLL